MKMKNLCLSLIGAFMFIGSGFTAGVSFESHPLRDAKAAVQFGQLLASGELGPADVDKVVEGTPEEIEAIKNMDLIFLQVPSERTDVSVHCGQALLKLTQVFFPVLSPDLAILVALYWTQVRDEVDCILGVNKPALIEEPDEQIIIDMVNRFGVLVNGDVALAEPLKEAFFALLGCDSRFALYV